MPGAPSLDWKVLAYVAGASFIANMIGLFVVVGFVTGPIKERGQETRALVISNGHKIEAHEKVNGHSGLPVLGAVVEAKFGSIEKKVDELSADFKSEMKWIRQNLNK